MKIYKYLNKINKIDKKRIRLRISKIISEFNWSFPENY